MKLECSVDVTDIDKEVSSSYDYEFDGTITREISEVPEITEDFSIGVIIGKSGSGSQPISPYLVNRIFLHGIAIYPLHLTLTLSRRPRTNSMALDLVQSRHGDSHAIPYQQEKATGQTLP